MAVSTNDVVVRLSMDEGVSDLVQKLDALNPYAVSELVLRHCVPCEPAKLCAQIGRCVRLRRLSCVGCALQPSKLLKFMLEQLRYLQQLELSLVEVSEVVVYSEINSMRPIALDMLDVIRYHSLRRLYVEVGGDRNFELLWELLVFCPNLTDFQVHFVRGTFSNALVHCHRLHELLHQLDTFTFTSELPASIPFPYRPDQSSTFTTCATVCANVRHDRSHDWWSCVELSDLVLSWDRAVVLPTQLVAFAAGDLWASLLKASWRHNWARVRELSLLILPPQLSMLTYPKAGAACRNYLQHLFFALDSIAELNVSSFHICLDFDLKGLLQDTPLGSRLLALSAPPCWFPRQSSVRMLPSACPNLRDLDVRSVSREGRLQCASCRDLHDRVEPIEEPYDAATSLSTRNARLTFCDLPYDVLRWYFEYFEAAVTLRLAEWRCVGSQQYAHLFGRLSESVDIRCLVLQYGNLAINNQHLQASLRRMTSLQHLSLLTSMQVSDADASKWVRDCVSRSAQLKCVHVHYRRDTDGLERRVTCLKRRQDEVLLQGGPCFACCSTATFIGLVKPLNRNCEAYL